MTAAAARIDGPQDVPPGRALPAVMTLSDSGSGNSRPQASSSSNSATTAFVKRYRTEIAASSSSFLSTLTAFPLDSVKTRMQTHHYNGFIDCVKQTYKAEKLGGFFRGNVFSSLFFCVCFLLRLGNMECTNL